MTDNLEAIKAELRNPLPRPSVRTGSVQTLRTYAPRGVSIRATSASPLLAMGVRSYLFLCVRIYVTQPLTSTVSPSLFRRRSEMTDFRWRFAVLCSEVVEYPGSSYRRMGLASTTSGRRAGTCFAAVRGPCNASVFRHAEKGIEALTALGDEGEVPDR